jgi:ribosomal-protein-alanine N-acetyltransferase
LSELKERKIAKVFLEVEHDNVPALSLYEKAGFVRYGYRRGYYGAGKDAVLMSLDL